MCLQGHLCSGQCGSGEAWVTELALAGLLMLSRDTPESFPLMALGRQGPFTQDTLLLPSSCVLVGELLGLFSGEAFSSIRSFQHGIRA